MPVIWWLAYLGAFALGIVFTVVAILTALLWMFGRIWAVEK